MQVELTPVLMNGKVVSVNDTAIKVDIQGRLGVITVPRRWVYTDTAPKEGQKVEFYFSYMQVLEEGEESINQLLQD